MEEDFLSDHIKLRVLGRRGPVGRRGIVKGREYDERRIARDLNLMQVTADFTEEGVKGLIREMANVCKRQGRARIVNTGVEENGW